MSYLFHVNVGLHPWMSSDFSNSWSVLAIVGEQFEDEILEIIRKVLSSSLLPVGGVIALKKQVVEVFIFLGLLEWENALDDDEEDDTGGEHVNLGTIISFAFFDLGSHVSHSSSV